MKIYNKRGLVWGAFCALLGGWRLVLCILSPANLLPVQIRDVVVSLFLLAAGITGFVRAFSKRATREDLTERMDERNRLVRLKSRAITADVIEWLLFAAMLCGLTAYCFTQNVGWAFLFVTSGVTLGIAILTELIATFYYERRE